MGAITEQRLAEFKELERLHEVFETVAKANDLKGKARIKAGFYFLQGIAAVTSKGDGGKVDPVIWTALIRDIDELKGLTKRFEK